MERERNRIIDQICGIIKGNRTFFLSGHQKPDGDTVASELAMLSLLSRLHKSAEVYNAEPVPESLSFLPGVKKIKTSKKLQKRYDVAILFECSNAARMGNIIDLEKQAKHVINIDHHLTNSFFGHINWVNSKASSNSEQLYYLFERFPMRMTKDEASCLYAGMMTDTGRFQYSNTNSETLRIASKLLECQVQPHLLCEKIYGTRSFAALKLLGLSLSELKFTSDQRIAYVQLSRDDFRKTGSTDEETEEIVNYGLQVPTALISILFRESSINGTIKVSLRSRREVNVSKLAEQFGGGGHKYASGCKVPGPMDETVKKILKAAQQSIRNTNLPAATTAH